MNVPNCSHRLETGWREAGEAKSCGAWPMPTKGSYCESAERRRSQSHHCWSGWNIWERPATLRSSRRLPADARPLGVDANRSLLPVSETGPRGHSPLPGEMQKMAASDRCDAHLENRPLGLYNRDIGLTIHRVRATPAWPREGTALLRSCHSRSTLALP